MTTIIIKKSNNDSAVKQYIDEAGWPVQQTLHLKPQSTYDNDSELRKQMKAVILNAGGVYQQI